MKSQKIIGIITARAGSKRLPGKNTRPLGHQPLLSWTINSAKKSNLLSNTILSSDDNNAIKIAKDLGCDVPFIRPDNLSDDHSTSFDVVKHTLDTLPETYDWLVLLQPTSPFRHTEDIDNAIKLALDSHVNSVISVCKSEKSFLMNFTKNDQGTLTSPYGINIMELNNTRSQDMPETYDINGAIYVVKVDWFLKHKVFFDSTTTCYEMPIERSVNIDTEHDWRVAESYLI